MNYIYLMFLLPAAVTCDFLVQEKAQRPRTTEEKATVEPSYDFNNYQTFNQMEKYLQFIAKQYVNKVSLIPIGTTYEKRNLWVLEIKTRATSAVEDKRPAIWIDSGIHAREWIAPAVGMRLIKELVENYDRNKALVDQYVWYIMPMVNPDGYVYSWTKDRYWRKNRSPGNLCVGVDLNRNFDMFWKEGKSSTDECDETYIGKNAFSEKETIAMRDFILSKQKNIALYLALHAYGQLVLFPWGVGDKRPANYEKLKMMGTSAKLAIKKSTGKNYNSGQVTDLMYPAGGCSDDWAMGKANIPLAFTYELRNKFTFILPSSEIDPAFRDFYSGLKAMVQKMNK